MNEEKHRNVPIADVGQASLVVKFKRGSVLLVFDDFVEFLDQILALLIRDWMCD